MLLSDDHEVRLVRQQGEHDQVGVSAVEAVARVRIVSGLGFRLADVIHHFVLTFTWD